MERQTRTTSRRSLLKYALGALGSIAAPASDVPSASPANRSYQVVDRRELSDGGLGLFIVVAQTTTKEELAGLAGQLRIDFGSSPSVVAEVFDDADAARTVRAGSRVVGEDRFRAAQAHQKASYHRTRRPVQDVFRVYE